MDKLLAIIVVIVLAIGGMILTGQPPKTLRFCHYCQGLTEPLQDWINHQQNIGGWVPVIILRQGEKQNRCSTCGHKYIQVMK